MNLVAPPSATPLHIFQARFARALLEADLAAAADLSTLAAQPGFAVYRNTVLKGCIDALQANYPAVGRLVGEDWFRGAAALFVRRDPPSSPVLLDYGAGFADFLQDFAPAAELPYLSAVARLDRAWTEAHVAADREPVAATEIAALSHEQLATVRLRPHPAARWLCVDSTPAFSIWQRNRWPGQDESELEWIGEAALLTRPHAAVAAVRIDAAACAFLDACAAGEPLARAAIAAAECDPGCDLAQLMSTLLQAGAFGALYFKESR